MSQSLKVAVVGAGAIGAAAALALARRGAKVQIIEQFQAGHTLGSSHGATRLFRTAYFENPAYVPVLLRAFDAWRSLEAAARTALLHHVGVIEAGRPDGPMMTGLNAAADRHGLALRSLSHRDLALRGITLPRGFDAVFEARAGFLRAEDAVAALQRLALAAGAVLRTQTRVTGWRTSDVIRVETDGETLPVDRLVLCPGAYAAALLGPQVPAVRPSGKRLLWFRPRTRGFGLADGALPFGVEMADGRFFYGFPAIDEAGVKIGEHSALALEDSPEAARASPPPGEDAAIIRFAADVLPGLDPAPGAAVTCLYEQSPDGDFMVDRHPADARVVFAAGLSGHGFKFAPVIGEALAQLAMDGAAPSDLAFLGLARFARPPAMDRSAREGPAD